MGVTILGITSIDKSIVELKVARNEKEMREIFYLSEGACVEGVQRLVNTTSIDLEEKIQCWHHSHETLVDNSVDFRSPLHWNVDGMDEDNGLAGSVNPNTYFAAVEWKIASGGSLVQTQSRLYQNRIYGLCDNYGAQTITEIGYYIRY
jgi:hypothetical protein